MQDQGAEGDRDGRRIQLPLRCVGKLPLHDIYHLLLGQLNLRDRAPTVKQIIVGAVFRIKIHFHRSDEVDGRHQNRHKCIERSNIMLRCPVKQPLDLFSDIRSAPGDHEM